MFSDVQWNNVKMPFMVTSWLVIIIIAKIIHKKSGVYRIIPESAILLVCGLGVGAVLDWHFGVDMWLIPDLFFLYLLPPIALEAGMTLPFRLLANNIVTILLYAILGTLMNITMIAGILWLFSAFFTSTVPFIDILLFATLISAVDPVAVLCVFEEIHVNQTLYINVFGESLLNDAVVIVLYKCISQISETSRVTGGNVDASQIIAAVISFGYVSIVGFMFGLLAFLITALSTKVSTDIPNVQPFIVVLVPYLCYIGCEAIHVSAIISIVVCALFMKKYVEGNMTEKMQHFTKYLLKILANNCEGIVFLFLGLSLFSRGHIWDFPFLITTIAVCLAARFVSTFLLTFLANLGRDQKIAYKDQAIIAIGGLRGAICYGLVQSIHSENPNKDMLVTTTAIIIVFTMLQGCFIKKLVKCFGVEIEEETEKTVTSKVLNRFSDDVMSGIEALVGKKGRNYLRRKLSDSNHRFLERVLMTKPTSRGEKIVQRVIELQHLENQRRLLDV